MRMADALRMADELPMAYASRMARCQGCSPSAEGLRVALMALAGSKEGFGRGTALDYGIPRPVFDSSQAKGLPLRISVIASDTGLMFIPRWLRDNPRIFS
jgi:hypothetical protein